MRTMYDGISPTRLPYGAQLYAGYDDGRWPDAYTIANRFPGIPVVRITTTWGDNAGDVLDVERGDATPEQAPTWVARRRCAGATPTVYCSLSAWPTLKDVFSADAMPEPNWWVADYTLTAADLPAGAVALQYASTPGYDVSVVADYWPGIDPVPPTATSVRKTVERMGVITMSVQIRTGIVVVEGVSGGHKVAFVADVAKAKTPDAYSVIDLSDRATAAGVAGAASFTD